MKSKLLLVMLFLLVSCDKSDVDIANNITQFQWELISMETSDEFLEPNLGNYHNERAYILNFLDKSTFRLNTGVNLARGNYSLIRNGKIFISNYQEYTEIGAARQEEREFNELQMELFPQVTTYKMEDKKLIIKGAGIEFVFQQLSNNE